MKTWRKLLTIALIAVVISSLDAEAKQSAKFSWQYHPSASVTPTVATSASASGRVNSNDINISDSDAFRNSKNDNRKQSGTYYFASSLSKVATVNVELPKNIKIGSTAYTKDNIVSTFRNWIGSSIGKPSDPAFDKACWRKAFIMDTCPYGFFYNTKVCWAQCPMAYPVECGVECLRQSDDCGSAIYAKFVSVANAFFSVQILGVFGAFSKLSKTVRIGIKCARAMLGTMRAIVNYVRAIKVSNPQTAEDQILLAIYQTSYITIDLPVSIVMCFGRSYNWEVLDPASVALGTMQVMLGEILARQENLFSTWDNFRAFLLRSNFTKAVNDLDDADITSLKKGLESNSTCGYELQRITDRTWRTIAEMKEENPGISQDALRVQVYQSDLMLHDIPTVTNNCMVQLTEETNEATAYKTRDMLRKTYGVIVDDLIDNGKSDNGTSLTAKQYTRVVADRVLMAIATLFYIDLTRISGMLSEYIETICGPTQLVGEIDDGTVPDTLGLRIVGDIFKGSSTSWKRKGDGVVVITFVSNDTKNVAVNILSGGDKFDEKDVPAGKIVTWISSVEELGGKTLYLDRWRAGFLGLPSNNGGSLKLWVPRASEGGHLEITVHLNKS
ncbi:uncharacterized protein CCR75_006130 [Bremia lactucae]|uniref:Uncharacterized protein n=1 Tax=Bremia lactucae TaxID=4779 RepID=A0A976FJ47_BRELC|nr:hypothetical protein CCR75_006130 [Bremia lactucae]